MPFPELARNVGFALNITQFGLVSLLSFLVYRQESHFRSVFFQFWFCFAVIALASPVIYHFLHWTGPMGGIRSFIILKILVHGLLFWTVVKILLHYLFHDEKRWAINLLAAAVVLPLSLWLFWPFYWNPDALLALPTAGNPATLYNPIRNPAIIVNLVSLSILLAFFLHKLKTDKPFGAFADTLLFLFGLIVVVDLAETLARVHSIEMMQITQWANSVIVLAMIITLLLRLKYKSQTIASYYESQCISHDPRIGRRVGLFDRLILWSFFDPKKVGQRIYLGTGSKKVTVKRTPRIARAVEDD